MNCRRSPRRDTPQGSAKKEKGRHPKPKVGLVAIYGLSMGKQVRLTTTLLRAGGCGLWVLASSNVFQNRTVLARNRILHIAAVEWWVPELKSNSKLGSTRELLELNKIFRYLYGCYSLHSHTSNKTICAQCTWPLAVSRCHSQLAYLHLYTYIKVHICKYSNSYIATMEHFFSSNFTDLVNHSLQSSNSQNTNTQQHGFQPYMPMIFNHINMISGPFHLITTHNISIHLESNQITSSSLLQTTTMAFLSMAISMREIWLPIHHHQQVQ
jgi:hypothetical protein